jgi:hypothetical protein
MMDNRINPEFEETPELMTRLRKYIFVSISTGQ